MKLAAPCPDAAFAAEPAQAQLGAFPGVVHNAVWRNEEVAVVGHSVLHIAAMLEMGVHRLLLLQLSILIFHHVELITHMLEEHLLPSSVQAAEVVGLFGLRHVVEGPFAPAFLRAAACPFVAEALMAVFVEKCRLVLGEALFVTLIAVHFLHEIGVSVVVVVVKCEVSPA